MQFDLKGHSAWGAAQDTEYEPALWREEFAVQLQAALTRFDFNRLFWAGDGGAFARPYEGNRKDADAAVEAADRAFEIFEAFKQRVKHGHQLGLRASATCLEVVIHPDASYWYSNNFNKFLKHERDIGVTDAFVITENLRKRLSRKIFERRFPHVRRVSLGSEDWISVFTDEQHLGQSVEPQQTNETKGSRFINWLVSHQNYVSPSRKLLPGSIDPGAVEFGETLIWDSAIDESGYDKIKMDQVEFDFHQLDKRLEFAKTKWQSLKQRAESTLGVTVAPLMIDSGVSDSRELKIEFAQVPHSIVESFHALVSDDQIWSQLAAEALQLRKPRVFPGSLYAHVLVVFGVRGNRNILVAHKAKNNATYATNCWSGSFEEQFTPVKSHRRSKVQEVDPDLFSTVIRGLRKKFLTEDFTAPIQVRIHAVGIELDNFNIDVLAVANLPTTEFSEICNLWPKAIDAKEHDVIAQMCLSKYYLDTAMNENGPKHLGDFVLFGPDSKHSLESYWHPTTAARFAMAEWLLDADVI